MDRREAALLLGVPEHASIDEVQHAYVRMVRRTHPDTMPTATDAERHEAALRFDALVQARHVLVEQMPVIPITLDVPVQPVPAPRRRGRGVGRSLAVLAVVVFLTLALVSLGDAFRIIDTGPLLP